MLDYSSTKEVQSQFHPGVSFTIRVISEGVRTRILMDLIDTMSEIRELQVEHQRLQDELPKKEDDSVDILKAMNSPIMARLQGLTDKVVLLRKTKVNPAYARVGFVSIAGISIDGNDTPSLEVIQERGSEKLYNEIVDAIRQEVELTEEQKQNLESPTTSGAPVAEAKINTTAPLAENTDIILDETATSISQAM